MKYIDIHTHLHDPQFDADRDEVIARMRAAEVGAITVGTDYERSKLAVELAEKHPDIWATVGLHPTDNAGEVFDIEKYKALASNPKVVAIGECGLDYFRTGKETVFEAQKEKFLKQLEIAVELDKPLMIHCRPTGKTIDAHEDMLAILTEAQKTHGKKVRGNIHFFTGNLDIAKRYNAIGFTISFPGVITFTKEYDDVVRGLPLDMIMVETDAPYAAPMPYRGKRNEPAFVVETLKYIVSLREDSFEDIVKTLRLNVQHKFDYQ